MERKPILIDVMLHDRFVCQLRYTAPGRLKIINGTIQEVHDVNDIRAYVEQRQPSIVGKNYRIAFSHHRILNR